MAENNDNNRGNNGDQNLLKSLTDLFCQLNNRLSHIENQDRTTNDGNIVNHTNRVKSNHENYVLSQIVKYDGKNLKHWLTSVKSAFRSCGYSHFLESELDENHPDYAIYQNCLGTISLTFIPEKFEVIEHCKSVFQVWSHMAKVEKDTYATAVRKFTELINCSYKGGSLRTWLETIIAKFESIESEWCKYTDKHRCVIVMCMLRSNSKFEQLADRIMMNQNGTMNDIMNEFIEYDEKIKSQSISSNFGLNEKTAKEKKKSKNGLKCSYCHKIGHKIEDCWEKQKCTPSSSTTNEKSSSTSQKSNSKNQKKVAKTLILKSVEKSSNIWILDSGCTSHTTVNENLLIDPKDKQVEFELASKDTVTSKKIGNVIIQPKPDCKLLLKDVAYGEFSSNLISVRKLTEDGFKIIFEDNVAYISKNDISFTAKTDENNLWIINSQPKNFVLNLWHKRLAHCGQNVLKRIKNDVPAINLKYETCEDCMMNKSISIPHHTPMIYNNVKPFEMLHVDLLEAPVPSVQGSKYGMLIVDHYSRFTFGIPIVSKSDAASNLIEFIKFHQKKFKREVKTIRTDRGKEFINNELKTFCEENGITHETTVGYSPQQNGIVERMNRTVFDTVRLLLNSSNAPHKLWAETMCTSIYVINTWIREDGKSPYEKFHNKKPCYDHLKTFGCEAFYHQPKPKRSKFDKTSVKLMFIGYTKSVSNFRLYNPVTDEVVITNDVKFNENKMYFNWFKTSRKTFDENSQSISSSIINMDDSNEDSEIESEDEEQFQRNEDTESVFSDSESITSSSSSNTINQSSSSTSRSYRDANYIPNEDEIESEDSLTLNENDDNEIIPRRSTRENRGVPPTRFGFKCVNTYNIPSTYDEAIKSAESNEWKQAIDKEIKQLVKYKVFEKVSHDQSRKVIPTKWIFTRKRDGTYKARLVACGYSQKFGIDYNEICSPTPDSSLTNIILSYAKTFNFKTRQLDVRTAFLNANLSEDLYVKTPPGFGNDGHLKLKKALYGLKQSPLMWYNTISSYLI